MSTALRILLLLLLAGTGVSGVYNGIDAWPEAASPSQHVVSAAEVLYGVSGLVAVWGLLRRRTWTPIVATVWGVFATIAGALATIAYGGPGVPLRAAVTAGAMLVILGSLVVWGTQALTRTTGER